MDHNNFNANTSLSAGRLYNFSWSSFCYFARQIIPFSSSQVPNKGILQMHRYNLESFIVLTWHTGSVLFVLGIVFLIEAVRCYREKTPLDPTFSSLSSVPGLARPNASSCETSCTGEPYFSSWQFGWKLNQCFYTLVWSLCTSAHKQKEPGSQ